jgi:hypothetical protein
MKFNLMEAADCEPTSGLRANGFGESQMSAEGKQRRGRMVPAMAALVVAVLGTSGILYQNFGPGNGPQVGGDANMITAAAVSRAGAIQIPTRAGQSAS